jgi:hypothetical protein
MVAGLPFRLATETEVHLFSPSKEKKLMGSFLFYEGGNIRSHVLGGNEREDLVKGKQGKVKNVSRVVLLHNYFSFPLICTILFRLLWDW